MALPWDPFSAVIKCPIRTRAPLILCSRMPKTGHGTPYWPDSNAIWNVGPLIHRNGMPYQNMGPLIHRSRMSYQNITWDSLFTVVECPTRKWDPLLISERFADELTNPYPVILQTHTGENAEATHTGLQLLVLQLWVVGGFVPVHWLGSTCCKLLPLVITHKTLRVCWQVVSLHVPQFNGCQLQSEMKGKKMFHYVFKLLMHYVYISVKF